MSDTESTSLLPARFLGNCSPKKMVGILLAIIIGSFILRSVISQVYQWGEPSRGDAPTIAFLLYGYFFQIIRALIQWPVLLAGFLSYTTHQALRRGDFDSEKNEGTKVTRNLITGAILLGLAAYALSMMLTPFWKGLEDFLFKEGVKFPYPKFGTLLGSNTLRSLPLLDERHDWAMRVMGVFAEVLCQIMACWMSVLTVLICYSAVTFSRRIWLSICGVVILDFLATYIIPQLLFFTFVMIDSNVGPAPLSLFIDLVASPVALALLVVAYSFVAKRFRKRVHAMWETRGQQ